MALQRGSRIREEIARLFFLSPLAFKDLGLASVLQSHWGIGDESHRSDELTIQSNSRNTEKEKHRG